MFVFLYNTNKHFLMSKEMSTLNEVIRTQIVGVTRIALGMPFDHICDRVKTHMQTNLSLRHSLIQVQKLEPIIFRVYEPSTQKKES